MSNRQRWPRADDRLLRIISLRRAARWSNQASAGKAFQGAQRRALRPEHRRDWQNGHLLQEVLTAQRSVQDLDL